jgi:glutamyl-tRNA(Gln) amidotransferase subunit E
MLASFKPFDEMTAEDYASIGLKCGLEVHQQLLTERKLFCRCPAGRYSDEYDAEILRHMRPTLSELGEYDGTALMEKKTRKNVFYRIHHETVCTYEFDDTPPFMVDEESLDIAIELSLLMRLNMVGELHIARKQYLDGSIPTGFQRTAILGVDGWIPYKGRRIGVRQLSIEEDACREVSDIGHDRVFLTDRLGMPLIEAVTEPDMRTPQEAADVCQIIRMLCRSTGKVRTGYGAGREDVNVSVRGGTRVEIKGVPQIWRIPHLIYNEAMRQCALLEIRHELKQRGVTPKTFAYSAHDVSRLVSKATYEPIRAALAEGLCAKCVVLRGFAGLLSHPTQEHTNFATEFSDRVRVVACLTKLPNMVHSDTAAESIPARDWKQLRRKTGAKANDALVLVWGDQRDAETACNEIALRAREATEGVPNDTRQAFKDGTNGFERVLPGADRMYPDTDLPPIEIPLERIERIRSGLPEYVWDREARYRRMNVPGELVEPMCVSPLAGLFDRIVSELSLHPRFVAVILFQRLKAFRREGLKPERLSDEELFGVFKAHADGRLAREGVPELIEMLLKASAPRAGVESRVAQLLDELRIHPIPEDELNAALAGAIEQAESGRFVSLGQKHRYLMGQLMRALVGRVDGKHLAEVLEERLSGWQNTAVAKGA